MIALLCYFWFLMWGIENTDKTLFAVFSTVEFAFEMFFIIPVAFICIPDWISNLRRKK